MDNGKKPIFEKNSDGQRTLRVSLQRVLHVLATMAFLAGAVFYLTARLEYQEIKAEIIAIRAQQAVNESKIENGTGQTQDVLTYIQLDESYHKQDLNRAELEGDKERAEKLNRLLDVIALLRKKQIEREILEQREKKGEQK